MSSLNLRSEIEISWKNEDLKKLPLWPLTSWTQNLIRSSLANAYMSQVLNWSVKWFPSYCKNHSIIMYTMTFDLVTSNLIRSSSLPWYKYIHEPGLNLIRQLLLNLLQQWKHDGRTDMHAATRNKMARIIHKDTRRFDFNPWFQLPWHIV